jgi:hypothetical protein
VIADISSFNTEYSARHKGNENPNTQHHSRLGGNDAFKVWRGFAFGFELHC